MNDVEEIKRRRLEELQARQREAIEEQLKQEAETQQQINALESFVKQRMAKKAVERYGNLKAADPEKAAQLLILLAQAIQTSGIDKISDDELRMLLMKMQPTKRDFKITRK